VLPLLMSAALREDYTQRAHYGMCGGHLSVLRTVDKIQLRAFSFGWRRFCKHRQNFNGYFRGQLPRSGPLQPMLLDRSTARQASHRFDRTKPSKPSRFSVHRRVPCVDPFSDFSVERFLHQIRKLLQLLG